VAAIVAGGLALADLGRSRVAVVDRLDPALLDAASLATSLLDQETAIRGYVITRDPSTLEPDERGRALQEQSAAALRADLTAAGATDLLGDLDRVQDRVRDWRARYADPAMAAIRAGGAPADPDAGKQLFDQVRVASETQRAELTAARDAARAQLDDAADRLTLTFAAIAAGLVLLLAGLALWVRRMLGDPISGLAESVRHVAGGQFGLALSARGPRELVGLGRDVDSMRTRIVTELRASQELNETLNRQADELSRSNRDLEQFAYVASHDLQEPLRKVSGFCELLRSRYSGQLDERADQYIDFAVDGSRRMSRLIAELLAFSRVGRHPVERTEVDCAEALEQALRNLAVPVTDSGAEVTHDRLPTVLGESSLLVTVFQNIIGNAVKFRGPEPPRVHVGATRRDDAWEFRVADNGIGIEPDYADKVFVIFQRLHAREAYPGTGIGLALCRKIIEYHGGTIWLDTEATEGAVFRFTLPALVPAAPVTVPDPGALRTELIDD
jgi:signal transduction histidine kinase